MFYIVNIIFANRTKPTGRYVKKHRCKNSILFLEAESAREAYSKAEAWGIEKETEYKMEFAGINQLKKFGKGLPKKNKELMSIKFQEEDFWEKIDNYVPDEEKIPLLKKEGAGTQKFNKKEMAAYKKIISGIERGLTLS